MYYRTVLKTIRILSSSKGFTIKSYVYRYTWFEDQMDGSQSVKDLSGNNTYI